MVYRWRYCRLTRFEAEFQSNIKVAIPKLFEILIHCDDKEVSARTLTAIKSLGVQSE